MSCIQYLIIHKLKLQYAREKRSIGVTLSLKITIQLKLSIGKFIYQIIQIKYIL